MKEFQKILAGQSQTLKYEGNEKPMHLIFDGANPDAKIETTLVKVTENDLKISPPIGLGLLVEAQYKIEKVLTGHSPTLKYSTEDGKRRFHNARLQIGIDGEINLEKDEVLRLSMTNLNEAGGTVSMIEGKTDATNLWRVTKQVYDGKFTEDELEVEDFDFLVFSRSRGKFPEMVDLIYADDRIKITEDYQKVIESVKYGVVAFDEFLNNAPIYGGTYSYVLDVRGVNKIFINDKRGNDIEFYGVNFS